MAYSLVNDVLIVTSASSNIFGTNRTPITIYYAYWQPTAEAFDGFEIKDGSQIIMHIDSSNKGGTTVPAQVIIPRPITVYDLSVTIISNGAAYFYLNGKFR